MDVTLKTTSFGGYDKKAVENYIDELNDLKSRDAFFTRDDVSYECIDVLLKYIEISLFDLIIEPSAGDGSFIRAMKNHDEFKNSSILSFDICPTRKSVNSSRLV